MREAVVVASSRTALAKSFRGSFNMTRPEDLAAHCIQDVLRKTPALDAAEIGDVILGCAQPHGMQGSKLRTVRIMSMPLKLSGPFSSKIGVCITASSYGPGVPKESRGLAFHGVGGYGW